MQGSGNDVVLPLLRHEAEKFVFVLIEHARDVDWAAEGPTGVHIAVYRKLGAVEVIDERVGVHELTALEPIAVAVKIFGAALGDHLHLRAIVTAEFGGLSVGGDLE